MKIYYSKEDISDLELKIYNIWSYLYEKNEKFTINHDLCKKMIERFILTEEYEKCDFLYKLIKENKNK